MKPMLVAVLCCGGWLANASVGDRPHESADYWRLLPHYQAQETDAGCSVASVAAAVGALSAKAPDQRALRASDTVWGEQTREGGEGVSFAELLVYLRRSLDRAGLADAQMQVFVPRIGDEAALATLRALLAASAANPDDVVLVSFDQGWLLGEASVGHVSPVGDYDPDSHRVLVMDVDRERFGPVWIPDRALLAAMRRADDDDPDGVIVIRRTRMALR
ncbi:MAG TPA: phytochelatin synthase family protein [Magnetospirillum sp.]|jgi:hypothetical protein|nr:phytochelatin synthase family protein [Magnetospirillum sp.]